jgi:hypothetical protein
MVHVQYLQDLRKGSMFSLWYMFRTFAKGDDFSWLAHTEGILPDPVIGMDLNCSHLLAHMIHVS